MQDFHEYPLLHQADLMLALLRVGSADAGDLGKAASRLRQDLDAAGESPPVTPQDIQAELAAALHHLHQAGLVNFVGDGKFSTSERGLRVLADYPLGVDDSVLMDFPEFRQHVARVARVDHPADPAFKAYQRGFAAFLSGRSHSDNPHRPDSAMHLGWENGWFEARDVMGPWVAPTAGPGRKKE